VLIGYLAPCIGVSQQSLCFQNYVAGIEIIYLEKSLCILEGILAMGMLCLMVLPPAQVYYIGCGATIELKCLLPWTSAVIYTVSSLDKYIIFIDIQTEKKSL
jgi:hypothetical protein